jgi:hypothetical protein
MVGAVVQLSEERRTEFFGFLPWWSFYVLGAAVMLTFPVLIWKRYRVFTRVLSVFPFIKGLTLLLKQGKLMGAGQDTVLYNWMFAVVAVVASVFLVRAGFGRDQRAGPTSEE